MTKLHEISIDGVKDHEYLPKNTIVKLVENISPNHSIPVISL